MKSKLLARILLLIAGALILADATAVGPVTTALGCVDGTPYCWKSSLVPCNAGSCVAWATAFPSIPAPPCNQNVNATNVTIELTAEAWTNCVASNDDEQSCTEVGNTCATYILYANNNCNVACPKGFNIDYCEANGALAGQCPSGQ